MNNDRRQLLKGLAIGSAVAASGCASAVASTSSSHLSYKGNVNHSVCRWTYAHLSVEELCELVNSLGFSAIDLVGPNDWPTLKKYGIYSSMCNGAEINLDDGFIHPQFHDQLVESYLKHIELVAAAGYKNLICFSGNARGMSKPEGLENATKCLKRIMPLAEEKGVIIQMELFNSKINHPDYMCDSSSWGIQLCQSLGSPNFKLLYDIYHMQINEGDIIRTIADNHQYFGHYHTGGVPGRHEIDETQELYYPAIIKAILKTGYKGYLAQEFLPTPATNAGKMESLKNAVRICDV